MPLKNLIVDNPAYRRQLGMKSEPSENDIAGTYTNMQRVLEAETWPWTIVTVEFADTRSSPPLAKVSISMHGATRSYTVPLGLEVHTQRLSVEGQFSVNQSDFGMTPFSALGGLMRVADEMGIQFKLTAERRN